jgi:hypothetical protein
LVANGREKQTTVSPQNETNKMTYIKTALSLINNSTADKFPNT